MIDRDIAAKYRLTGRRRGGHAMPSGITHSLTLITYENNNKMPETNSSEKGKCFTTRKFRKNAHYCAIQHFPSDNVVGVCGGTVLSR